MPPSNAFDLLRPALERASVRYAVGGSWASAAWGEPRFTNDVDILADFTPQNLDAFLHALPDAFYVDGKEASQATNLGRPFNVIHTPTLLKFDFFPAAAFALGAEELDRAISLENTLLSQAPVRFVTPEDILLAKLYWFRLGGEVSEVQWRDIQGVIIACAKSLDHNYLQHSAPKLGVDDLLHRALQSPENNPH